jgi:membrane-associated protease RseP (regulator of RpoE activity)
MRLFLLLILSGLLTYAIVRRSVSQMTRTPIWLLWSVLMAPPLLTGAIMTWGKNIPTIPIAIAICLVCWGLYWRLLDLGRQQPQPIRGETAIVEPTNSSSGSESEGSGEKTPIRPIDSEEEATLRTCFPWNIFFLERIEYRPQAVLCRGKLRANSELAYQTIEQNVKNLFGDRFLVLFQTSLSTGKPFFAIVPNPQLEEIGHPAHRWTEYTIAILLLLLTFLPTTFFGAALARLGMRLDRTDVIDIIISGLPYALSLIGILAARDLVRYVVARFYRISTTLPYFIPLPFFPGTFGALVQLRSPIPHRQAVFDLGFASSVVGIIVTLPLLIWGLSQSTTMTLTKPSSIFSFQSFDPRFSLLLSLLSKVILGEAFTTAQGIVLHPVAIAAYIGLLIITINLMPLRRFDGGYIVHAMFGQKPSVAIGQLSKIILLLLGLIRFKASGFVTTDLLFLSIVVSLIPAIDEPALNDVSDLNNWRDALGILALSILVLTIVPIPPVLMQLLGI